MLWARLLGSTPGAILQTTLTRSLQLSRLATLHDMLKTCTRGPILQSLGPSSQIRAQAAGEEGFLPHRRPSRIIIDSYTLSLRARGLWTPCGTDLNQVSGNLIAACMQGELRQQDEPNHKRVERDKATGGPIHTSCSSSRDAVNRGWKGERHEMGTKANNTNRAVLPNLYYMPSQFIFGWLFLPYEAIVSPPSGVPAVWIPNLVGDLVFPRLVFWRAWLMGTARLSPTQVLDI